jgi:beta-phosphoglucomutase-like phosphatase (HAD superfamily)
MPRAAIFDIDGTLVDSVDLHASVARGAGQVRPPGPSNKLVPRLALAAAS